MMLQPLKEAVPPEALLGFVEQVRVVPPGVPVTVKVTEAVLVVTRLPLESCTTTTGCTPNGALFAASDGLVWKLSLLAAPGVIVKDVLVAADRLPDVALRV